MSAPLEASENQVRFLKTENLDSQRVPLKREQMNLSVLQPPTALGLLALDRISQKLYEPAVEKMLDMTMSHSL